MVATSCRRCHRVSKSAICSYCVKFEPGHKLSRQQRGYDSEYNRNRQVMIDFAWRIGAPCFICRRPFASRAEITAEHVKPLRDGGTGELANLAPAHSRCNSSRRSP